MPAVPRIEKVVSNGEYLYIFVKNVGDATLKFGYLTGKVQEYDGTVSGFRECPSSADLEPGETAKTMYRVKYGNSSQKKSISIKEFEEYAEGGATYPLNVTITRGFFGWKKMEGN